MATAAIAADAAPCHDPFTRSETTDENESAAELSSLPNPAQAAAAVSIGPEPAPEYICVDVTSGGNPAKLICSRPFLALIDDQLTTPVTRDGRATNRASKPVASM
ncbi:hypothetical protein MCNS_07500 [Mycobacterium conspicuum]|uniref:Uncharacterized protein n=1 Tax=Mycobacterium conspicuum TaxID=44010 RepID=A0A7I7Y7W5_9MYCO|nr:hypothetical protein MCNS_07500 [Mycobacterium conspicuum]